MTNCSSNHHNCNLSL